MRKASLRSGRIRRNRRSASAGPGGRKHENAHVLLMGDATDRAPHAAMLLRDRIGKTIVFVETEQDELVKAGVRTPEGRMVYEYLTKALKVPEDKIIFESKIKYGLLA